MPMARVNNQGGVGDPVGPDVRPKSPKDTEMHVLQFGSMLSSLYARLTKYNIVLLSNFVASINMSYLLLDIAAMVSIATSYYPILVWCHYGCNIVCELQYYKSLLRHLCMGCHQGQI